MFRAELKRMGSAFATALAVGLVFGACDSEDPTGGTVSCTSEVALTNADIRGGTTLTAGTCYLVSENLSLSDGTVVAQAGVVVKFATGISFHVKTGGRLQLNGTATNPVSFTSQDSVGTWRGIRFTDSQSADNTWSYAVIDRAGDDEWTGASYSAAAVYLEGQTTIAMDHVTISNSQSKGLIAFDEVDLTFSAGTFDGNETPAHLHPQVANAIDADAVFNSNTNDYIRLVFGNNDKVKGTQSWPPHRYQISDRFFVEGDLTIEAGAELSFTQDVSMIVQSSGSLTAVGSADSPITFKGAVSTRGHWQGIELRSGGTGDPVTIGATLDHCVISDAGGRPFSGNSESQAALYLQDTSAAKITNTTFTNSERYGIWAGNNARLPDFGDNTFSNNARAMILHPDRVGELAGSSSISGNDEEGVYVVFGNNDRVTVAATWKNLNVPYVIRDRFFVDAALTIAAGTTVHFPQEQGMIVRDDGSLTTEGTATEPVVFRGQNEVSAGYWQGLRIQSNDAANKLTHTSLLHAGAKRWTGDGESDAAIHVDSGAQITLDNVTFGPGGGYALYLAEADSALSCTAVSFGTLIKGNIWMDYPGSGGVSAACP